ncbi:GtrA family protein [Candidatus Uhrbacteria bacterium]|nr:GtrA family protein [Candidatus Uhrbacteria bacterium]
MGLSCRSLKGTVARWRGQAAVPQFVRFCAVGFVNTGVDFSVYLALTRLTDFWNGHLVAASAVGFSLAVLSSFFLNTFWTFRCSGTGWPRRIGRFFAVAVGGLAVSSATVWLVVSLGVWDVIAKVAAVVLAMAWNFNMQRRWTFGSG